jgi:RNA polymerase sigma factor (sigma-70 family)
LASGNGLIAASSRVRLRLAPDDRLVAFVRRGDPAAFETLYERHAAELLSFCTYMLGSRHDAEDALQMTFVAAYRALLTHRRPVALRPWLFAIARNDCLNLLRKRRPTSELNGEIALNGDPFRELELKDEVTQTFKGILELPESQRAAIVLAEMHGLSHAEIGHVLGARPEQVKAYVYQARSHLISARSARNADCDEIREELATARGGTLLRQRLRGHVRTCAGCRAYADGVTHHRRQLGALAPWLPSIWLKTRVLGHALAIRSASPPYVRGVAAGGSLAGAAAEVATGGAKGLLVKVATGVACIGASACVGASVLGGSILPGQGHPSGPSIAPAAAPRAAAAASARPVAVASAGGSTPERSRTRPQRVQVAPVGEPGSSYPVRDRQGAGTGAATGSLGYDSVPTEGQARPAGEAGQGQRRRAGGEERQRQSNTGQRRSEERRRGGGSRLPRPSREERQRERELQRERVGTSGPPKKNKEERLKLREERQREHQRP